MPSYAQRYVDALLAHVVGQRADDARLIGEIDAHEPSQPHVAVFVELASGRYVGTTAGVSARRTALPVMSGFRHFELCALTEGHSAKILSLLSSVASFMLASPRAFLPYQTIRFGDSDERVMLVPRFELHVPDGPPVAVIEPVPVDADDWSAIGSMPLETRAAWARALGTASATRWRRLHAT